ncbi:MAG TPA: energy transducer TonB [Terriglobales bacterium]|nr:energy transducer TonB [Terriglobales bacterium]
MPPQPSARFRSRLGSPAERGASPSAPPLAWRGEQFLLSGGSLGLGAEQRRRRRRSLAISLGMQGLLVGLMLAALVVGPRAVRVPAVAAGVERLTVLVLAPPRRAGPRPPEPRPLRAPPLPRVAREALASGRVAALPPPPVARPEAAGRLPAPAALALGGAPWPALPAPRVAAPRPQLGKFGAPRGLAPVRGAPVPAPQLGQFGAAAVAQPAAAGGAVVGAGFGRGVGAGPGVPQGTVRAAGFGAGAGTAAAGAAGAGGSVQLDRFAAAAPVVSSEIPPPPPEAAPEFQPPQVLSWPTPAYTAAAAAHRVEGEVVLQVRLRADGHAEVLQVTRGLGYGLDQSAAAAARQLVFRPARRRGQPVDWTVFLHIQFRLAY